MATDEATPLASLIATELRQPAPSAALALAELIRERHGSSLVAILFYGSCLRKQTSEGVLDFYAIVDGYRAAYPGRLLAWANATVPPNVFYIERAAPEGTLRAKYAVLSSADFEHLVGPRARHPYVWARFCQPSMLVYARDEASRALAEACAIEACITAVRRLAVFLPGKRRVQRFSMAALWQEMFRRTYDSELRTESDNAVRALYDADPDRFDAVGREALFALQRSGWLESVEIRGNSAEVRQQAIRRRLARMRWTAERPGAKLLAFVRLIKNSTTFGDWLPYALWKVERHTGIAIELSERQRKHPLIFGWPVIYRLFRERGLR